MADFIKLTKEGFIPYEWDGDENVRDYVPETTTPNIFTLLRSRVELAEGITLGDLFKVVEAYPALCDFIGHYSWCAAINDFHAQAKLDRPEKENSDEEDEEIVALHVTPYGELFHNDETGEDSFEGVWWHFGGKGEKDTNFSVSYTPMYELVHLPLVIDSQIRFSKNYALYFEAKCRCNLLELLDAIYWDISFMGGPEDNVNFLENIHGMVEDLKTGLATTKPFESDDDTKN